MPTAPQDRFVVIEGMRFRYLEEGTGSPVLFLHGASLGSSADVFARNLSPFARAGFRAMAFDLPGFGLSDIPADHSLAFQRKAIPTFIDAMHLSPVALIAHSRSGRLALELALEDPGRYSHLVILGTGMLLPPQTEAQVGRYEAVQARVDRDMAEKEPTLEEARKLLQADTFHHDLISDANVAVRHQRSIGRNFEAHVARVAREGTGAGPATPLWQRLTEVKVPMLMIYGREDRAHAAERAELLMRMQPGLDLHLVSNCKHMVHWDAQAEMERLAMAFFRKG